MSSDWAARTDMGCGATRSTQNHCLVGWGCYFFKDCTAAAIVWAFRDCQALVWLYEECLWGGFYCSQLENSSSPQAQSHMPTTHRLSSALEWSESQSPPQGTHVEPICASSWPTSYHNLQEIRPSNMPTGTEAQWSWPLLRLLVPLWNLFFFHSGRQ